MPLGDIVKVRFLTFTSRQIGVNVTHWQVTAQTGPSLPLPQIALKFDQIFAPLYKNLLAEQATYRGVGVQRVVPVPPSQESTSASLPGVGLAAGEPLPGQIAGLLSFKTQFAGRKFRGRLYVPFPSEIQNAPPDATPSPGYITALQNLGTALLQPVQADDTTNFVTLRLGIFHRPTNTIDQVLSFVPLSNWATQRRRGAFGAANVPDF